MEKVVNNSKILLFTLKTLNNIIEKEYLNPIINFIRYYIKRTTYNSSYFVIELLKHICKIFGNRS